IRPSEFIQYQVISNDFSRLFFLDIRPVSLFNFNVMGIVNFICSSEICIHRVGGRFKHCYWNNNLSREIGSGMEHFGQTQLAKHRNETTVGDGNFKSDPKFIIVQPEKEASR